MHQIRRRKRNEKQTTLALRLVFHRKETVVNWKKTSRGLSLFSIW
jgi:hypothetical protein